MQNKKWVREFHTNWIVYVCRSVQDVYSFFGPFDWIKDNAKNRWYLIRMYFGPYFFPDNLMLMMEIMSSLNKRPIKLIYEWFERQLTPYPNWKCFMPFEGRFVPQFDKLRFNIEYWNDFVYSTKKKQTEQIFEIIAGISERITIPKCCQTIKRSNNKRWIIRK